MVLDHDHETGLERGYLCRACNRDESDTDGIWEAWRTGVNPRDMYFEPSVYRNHAGDIVLRDPTSMAWAMCIIATRPSDPQREPAMAWLIRNRDEAYARRRDPELMRAHEIERMAALAESMRSLPSLDAMLLRSPMTGVIE